MAFTGDSYIDKLLGDLSRLQGKPVQPTPAAQPASNNVGSYQAPIKGTWYSSGGFDASGALRPNGRKGHQGVDMRAQAGTPIYPMAPGTVSSVGTDPLGGNVVNIQHANGVRTYYAHCATVKVHKGDKVDNNTVIGTVGETGNAKGTVPHCHFQVWVNNQIQDPAKFFSIPKYTVQSAEEKKRGPWLNEQAKQDAEAFNMRRHVQQKRLAFTATVDDLVAQANQYYKLTTR